MGWQSPWAQMAGGEQDKATLDSGWQTGNGVAGPSACKPLGVPYYPLNDERNDLTNFK